MKTKDALRELAIRANNMIMRGSFSGDDIHEAAQLMDFCIRIVDLLDASNKEKPDE